jgi:hypothetical protein
VRGGSVRLQGAGLGLIQALDLDAIDAPALLQGGQARVLLGIARDDELAAALQGQAALGAERLPSGVAVAGEARLEALSAVIDPAVQHTAVAAAGMLAEAGLFVDEGQVGARVALLECAGDGEADDAGADDEVVCIHGSRAVG